MVTAASPSSARRAYTWEAIRRSLSGVCHVPNVRPSVRVRPRTCASSKSERSGLKFSVTYDCLRDEPRSAAGVVFASNVQSARNVTTYVLPASRWTRAAATHDRVKEPNVAPGWHVPLSW